MVKKHIDKKARDRYNRITKNNSKNKPTINIKNQIFCLQNRKKVIL